MTTKVVPQHQETPVLSLKHLSVFCSWENKKQRNNSDQYNGLEKELGPYTGLYCITLSLRHSLTHTNTHKHRPRHTHTHTQRNRHFIHTHSAKTYFLTPTSKHIYLICIDSYVIKVS